MFRRQKDFCYNHSSDIHAYLSCTTGSILPFGCNMKRQKRTPHTLGLCSCNVNLILLWDFKMFRGKKGKFGKKKHRMQATSPFVFRNIYRQVLNSAREKISVYIKKVHPLKKKWTTKFDSYFLTDIYSSQYYCNSPQHWVCLGNRSTVNNLISTTRKENKYTCYSNVRGVIFMSTSRFTVGCSCQMNGSCEETKMIVSNLPDVSLSFMLFFFNSWTAKRKKN